MDSIESALRQAQSLQQTGDGAEAAAAYRRVLELAPDQPEATFNLGGLLFQMGRAEEAEPLLRRAVALFPAHPGAHFNLGRLLLDTGRFAEAVSSFRKATVFASHWAEPRARIGHALMAMGRFKQAEESYRRAVALKPADAGGYVNLGGALLRQFRAEEAKTCWLRALELDPDCIAASGNLGVVARDADSLNAAEAAFRRALARDPDDTATLHNLWNLLLLRGDYAEGRRARENWMRRSGFKRRPFAQPRWDGEPMPGKTLLVYADHGFGDAIQFLRHLPRAKAQSQARILLEVPPELLPLARLLPDADDFAARLSFDAVPAAPFDAQIGLMSLDERFALTLETIPNAVPYLRPSADRAEAWRERLAAWDGLKIGICWSGDPSNEWNAMRECAPADFAALARIPGVRLFSLQKGASPQTLAALPPEMSLIDLTPDLTDFGETAALMQALDLVITVETATAHLAGALGLPTWTLLAAVASWQWLLDRDDSPWYPTMRLFRQTALGDWKGVFARVETALTSLMETVFV